MATNSNMGFHQGTMIPPATFNRHAISFHSGAAASSSTGILSPDSGGITESYSNFRHDASGLVMEWEPEEQSVLEEGLIKYAGETNIMKYIKIAADLRDKTVRDVALRCHWMTRKESGKRRKPEDNNTGKKMKDRKEKMIDSSIRTNMCPVSQPSSATYPLFVTPQTDNSYALLCEALTTTVGSATRHMLEENVRALNQIASNLKTYQVQDNFDLFDRTRSNLQAILNDMSELPGIMSHMPPLQVTINQELASTILPNTTQGGIYCDPIIQLKQELLR